MSEHIGKTYLHTISDHSLHKGILSPEQIVAICEAHNITSIGITDYNTTGGNMNGTIGLHKKLASRGINLIVGAKFDIKNPTSNTFDKICLYAKNQDGYKNLMKLSSLSSTSEKKTSFLTKGELFSQSEDILCVFPFHEGEISRLLTEGDEYGAEVLLDEYSDYFSDNLFLELSRQSGAKSDIDLPMRKLAEEQAIPLLPGTETYFYSPKAQSVQEAIVAVREKRLLHAPHEPILPDGDFSFQSEEKLKDSFSDIPEILDNVNKIGSMCSVSPVAQKPTPPLFRFCRESAAALGLTLPFPEKELSKENDDFLFSYMSTEGLSKRLSSVPPEKHSEYTARLEHERNIISSMGFSGYFLIEEDIVSMARAKGIPVGPGRGSAVGSLVAFSLEITNIDPMPYGLLFERFLNPEREGLPDIDVDFCAERRGELLSLIVDRYGEEYTGQISAYDIMKVSSSIRLAGKLFGVSQANVDILANLVKPYKTLAEASTHPRIEEYKKSETYKKLWKYARVLEGKKSHTTTHASGFVISDTPLHEKSPTYEGKNGGRVSQYPGEAVEDADLIKFDILGLKTLTVIERCLSLVEETEGFRPDLKSVDREDPAIYNLIATGETRGLFQIDGAGVQSLVRNVQPTSFNHLCQILALNRPGPMESGMTDDYIERRHGRAETSYTFPELENILGETYGVMLYQEQIMKITSAIGGFSPSEADRVRVGMGKKDKDIIESMGKDFVSGAVEKGFDERKSYDLFQQIVKFSGYGFNKSHSAAYADITFATAYLKNYFPSEFMSALMTTEKGGNMEKVGHLIQDAKNINIPIVPPSVNLSDSDFSIKKVDDEKSIIFGLRTVKGVGKAVASGISSARGEEPFVSMGDFLFRCKSVPFNKAALEALVLVGAFDFTGHNRSTLVNNIDSLMQIKKTSTGIKLDNSFIKNKESEYSKTTLLNHEMTLTGTYISGHPLDGYRDKISALNKTDLRDIDCLEHNTSVVFAGMGEIEEKISKKNTPYFSLRLTDLYSSRDFYLTDKMKEKLDKYSLSRPIVLEGGSTITDKGFQNIKLYDVRGIDSASKKKINVNTRYKDSVPMQATKKPSEEELVLLLQPTTREDYEEAMLLARDLLQASYNSEMVASEGIRFRIVSGNSARGLKLTSSEIGYIPRDILERVYREHGFDVVTGTRLPQSGKKKSIDALDFDEGVKMISGALTAETERLLRNKGV